MTQRRYTVFLSGGAEFSLKAARFEVKEEGVFFYDENGKALDGTFIDPSAVVAVLPPEEPASAHFISPFTSGSEPHSEE